VSFLRSSLRRWVIGAYWGLALTRARAGEPMSYHPVPPAACMIPPEVIGRRPRRRVHQMRRRLEPHEKTEREKPEITEPSGLLSRCILPALPFRAYGFPAGRRESELLLIYRSELGSCVTLEPCVLRKGPGAASGIVVLKRWTRSGSASKFPPSRLGLPLFCSAFLRFGRSRCRTGGEPGETGTRAFRSDRVGTSASGQAGWRRERDQTSQRNCRTRQERPEGGYVDLMELT